MSRAAGLINCDLLRIHPNGLKYIKGAYSTILCRKHKITSKVTNQSLINGRLLGCKECGLDAKRVPIEDVLKQALQCNENYYDISFYGTVADGDLYRCRCKTCDNDIITKNNYLDGFFYFNRSSLVGGCVSCRCSPHYRHKEAHVDLIARKDVESISDNLKYLGYEKPFKGKCTNIFYECKLHGEFVKPWGRIIENKACKYCGPYSSNSWGLIKYKKYDDDYLYLIRLYNEHEDFIKIGRTFNLNTRFNNFNKYTTQIIKLVKMEHWKILQTEKYIHKYFHKSYKYIPTHNLSHGSVSRESYNYSILYEDTIDYIFSLSKPAQESSQSNSNSTSTSSNTNTPEPKIDAAQSHLAPNLDDGWDDDVPF